MRVKCIKDTIGYKSWKIYEAVQGKLLFWDDLVDRYWEKYPDYFQEVKEEKINKPRWKVGSPVVLIWEWNNNEFTNIESIIDCSPHLYVISNHNWSIENLRDPTPEELKTYFR